MAGLVPGQVLEGTSYQVVREIGAGGMGVVYEVEHVRLKKRYVAKVIHELIRGDATAAKRMEREAHVLAEINHPSVVQVHDVGTTPDGTSYFVMEKLEGHDLRFAMKSGGITAFRAVSIVVDILDALDHVHRRGIVHRDIKPENVFLARMPNGIVTKVLDFGIVHIFDAERASQARITKTGGFVGTLYYAAPEQMQGNKAGPANDVYASALVLFELLTGRGPFDDDPGVGLSRCFKAAPRLPQSDRIPPALVDAVAAGLETDPDKRPAAGDLAARLRAVLSTVPTDPGHGVPSLRGDISHLLAQVGPVAIPSGLTGLTATPPTPLMSGAPARPTTGGGLAPTIASPGMSTPPPQSLAYGPTVGSPMFSPAITNAPPLDTSPGVTAPVSQAAPPASRAVMFFAIAGALCVLGLIGTVGVRAFGSRTATPPINATAVSVPPPSVAIPEPEPEPAPAPTPTQTEPAAAAPPAAVSASAAPVVAKPAASHRPTDVKRRGNAEKEGYFNDL